MVGSSLVRAFRILRSRIHSLRDGNDGEGRGQHVGAMAGARPPRDQAACRTGCDQLARTV